MGCGAGAQRRYDAVQSLEGRSVEKLDPSQPSSGGPSGGGDGATGSKAIRVGVAVLLKDLKACPELNGTVATVLSYDPAADRWVVKLESGAEKAIKAANLVVATLKVGAYVRLTGLKADAVLNGMVGIVESYDASTGRWTVKLSGGVMKSLKEGNLIAVQKERAPSKDGSAGGDAASAVEPFRQVYRPGPYEIIGGSQLHAALEAGRVRLVRGSYFERRAAEGQPWQRRQDVSEEDLWPPKEAARLWASLGSAFLLVVSYPWLSREHSDPEQFHLKRLARIIREWRAAAAAAPPGGLIGARSRSKQARTPTTSAAEEQAAAAAAKAAGEEAFTDVGVFVDFCCFLQKPGGGPAREESGFHPFMEVMALIYGHAHTSVLRLTNVPQRIEKKYHHRGWTAFESCLAANKSSADDKLFEFNEFFSPDSEPSAKLSFLRKFKQRQAPPVSYERFSDLLWRLEEDVKRLRAPYNRLFTQSEDKAWVLNKFSEAWDEKKKVRELDFKSMGWEDAEALQLAAALPSFPSLETLHLTGNKIGDAGVEAILNALVNSHLNSLDLSDNRIGEAGAASMAAALPGATDLEYLYAFANPFCSSEDKRWQVTNAWKAADKPASHLVLDHFALRAEAQ